MENNEFIFGTRAVIEAIKNNRLIEKVLIKKGLDNELFQELFHMIRDNQINFQFVPVEKINRITRKNHQGIIALISPIEYFDIEILLPAWFEKGIAPLILILDQITDVRNFGAIARSAECAGVNAIIIPEKGTARIGADAIKTSAGALHHIPVCKSDNLPKTIKFLKDSGVRIVAATEKADKLYTSAQMNHPVGIVTGSEENGISKQILQLADEQVKIPVFGKIESLNVSAAATLIIYEAIRQRS